MEIDPSQQKKRSLYQNLRFWRQHESTQSFDSDELRFLELCSGRDMEAATPESNAYLSHLRSLTNGNWTCEMEKLIHSEYVLLSEPFGKTIQLCSEVADLLREHGGISINKVVQKLQIKKVLCEGPDLCRDPFAQSLIFSIIGWLSLLYIPTKRVRSNELRVTIQSTKSTIRSNVTTETVARPLDELLRSFGDLLPRKIRRPTSDGQTYGQETTMKFQVSHLNVATMKDMANIQITWVDSLSAHLEFDPTAPSVSIFRCPSFCKIHQSEDSTLAIMLRQMYEEDEKPSEDFSVANMLGEVMLSYTLLFRSNRRSRKSYQSSERARASLTKSANRLQVDPCLDELCGNNSSASFFTIGSSVRDSYDSDSDFPIFKDRLKKIQDYMEGIEPNRFMSLWRDRRDLRLWYTIWTVIILGVIGLIQATISLFLAAVQVDFARKSYESQLRQNSQNS